MDLSLLTLCDSAQDYNGKLCVLGTFDSFAARELPVVHPGCAIAMRFIFTPEDEGERELTIRLLNEKEEDILPQQMKANIPFNLPPGANFFSRNLVVGMQGLRFEEAGDYHLEVAIDGNVLKKLPLRVLVVPAQEQPMG